MTKQLHNLLEKKTTKKYFCSPPAPYSTENTAKRKLSVCVLPGFIKSW